MRDTRPGQIEAVMAKHLTLTRQIRPSPPQREARRLGPKASNLAVAARGYESLFKFLFIGDSGVGKTSLIWRFSDDMFNKAFIHTIGKFLF